MSMDVPVPVPVPAPVVVHREVPVQAQPSPKRRRSFTPIPDVAEVIVVADETKPPTIPQLSVTSSDFIERAVPVARLPARVSPVAPLAVAASTSRSPARPTAAPVVSTSALGNAVRTYESRQKPTAPTVAKTPSPSLPTPQKVSAVSSAGRRAVAQCNDVVVSDDKADDDDNDDNNDDDDNNNDDSGGDADELPVGKPVAKRLSKGSGSKGPLSKHRVLLSHAASSRWINKLKDLGAEVLNSETIESLTVRSGDVFVACVKRTPDLQPKASFKLLLALALRAPIVTYEWIDACVEQQKCLGVEPYLLSLRQVIDADAPERRDDLPSMDGRRIELIGGTESVRKQMSFILERLGVQVIKGDSRVLGQYKLTAAISFGDGARATQRAQEMRAHKYAVVGIKWLKYCLCAGGYVDPLSSESFAADDVEPMPAKSRYVYDDAEIDEDEVPRTRSSKRKAAAAIAEEDDKKKNKNKKKKKKKDDDEEEVEEEEEVQQEEVEEEDDDEDDKPVSIVRVKQSRVLASQSEEVAAKPLTLDDIDDESDDEMPGEAEAVPGEPIDEVATDVVDIEGESVEDVEQSTEEKSKRVDSISAIVPSSPGVEPPPADNADLSLSFDDIKNTQAQASQLPLNRIQTPVSSPRVVKPQPAPFEVFESFQVDESSDIVVPSNMDADVPVTAHDLASVVAGQKAAPPLWVHDREFELEQARAESAVDTKATQYN
jgi:hypothetical protein